MSRIEALQEEAKILGSPSTLVVRIYELESSLKEEKKQRYETYNVVTHMEFHAEEARKAL